MPVSRSRKPKSNRAPGPGREPRPGGRPGTSRAAGAGGRSRRAAVGVVAVVVVLFLLVGSAAALLVGGGDEASDGAGGEESVVPLPDGHPALELARRDADDPLAIGDVDAPVVVIEYADFQCAFCGTHARGVHERLVEEYVETGVVRIEFRNFPINGPESDAAARAAWAAGRQGRFEEFYRAAFAEEFHLDSGRFSEEGLRELAEEAGVPDVELMLTEMESPEAGEAVGADAEEAMELGIVTPPSFLVNGHPVQGARPFDEFAEVIEPLAEAAGDS
ncbi:DsbA family protein [Streptomyces triticirhizae]|uniref:Disulfide bond formation protein DsbA n=1 Tax=Streptomyces triticirhizae TaxID=2483353 RepID=A0A3M2LN71_9ACTN|nr:thioredoxin domain-containing protein [Streptomyces triticirhizae]RMI37535.1 disulfide bond formation protein DsbA [Streptomyces triticirhizae]